MLTVTVYFRPGCHLCDQAFLDLDQLQSTIPHQLRAINIDEDPVLQKKYLLEVPVVKVGAFELKAPFGRAELQIALGAAQDGNAQTERIALQSPAKTSFADKFSLWIANHWLLGVNLLFLIYLGLPILAPVLMKMGAPIPARVIYTVYSPLCHQLGFRSFFLFGSQPFYPREVANVSGYATFGQVTGLDENDLISARKFVGNETVGYKVALCERDIAIYAAIIVFGFVFGLSNRRIRPLHWVLWLLLAIGPIGLDGFSQLFSQLPIPVIQNLLPYRESTPLLRVLTGAFFGFGTAWFGLPYIEESMQETKNLINRKLIL